MSPLQSVTGLATLYDFVFVKQRDYATDAVGTFLNRAEAKTALGARGNMAWAEYHVVGVAMHGDVMRYRGARVTSMSRSATLVKPCTTTTALDQMPALLSGRQAGLK